MADFKLSYTANEINEKLGKIGSPISWNDLTDKPFGEETEIFEPITWDGNTDGLVEIDIGDGVKYYKVSDKVFSNEQIKMMSYSYYQTGTPADECVCHYRDEWEGMADSGAITDDIVCGIGVHFVRKAGAVDYNGAVYPETGVYFCKEEILAYGVLYYITSLYVEGNAISTIKKLGEKYLPDSVDGVVIRSSTADSTKKFKLTVDDSGTIRAVEIGQITNE